MQSITYATCTHIKHWSDLDQHAVMCLRLEICSHQLASNMLQTNKLLFHGPESFVLWGLFFWYNPPHNNFHIVTNCTSHLIAKWPVICVRQCRRICASFAADHDWNYSWLWRIFNTQDEFHLTSHWLDTLGHFDLTIWCSSKKQQLVWQTRNKISRPASCKTRFMAFSFE